MTDVTVTGLWIYPIKSLPGIAMQSLAFDDLGARNDRRYMLVDEQGLFITQRTFACLCLIEVAEHDEGWMITLPSSAEQSSKLLPFNGDCSAAVDVTVWSDTVTAYDQGQAWSAFFSEYLQHAVKLVYIPADSVRQVDEHYTEQSRRVGFADGFPLLLCAEESLTAFNAGLSEAITMTRFRPNIIVKGQQAFAEDDWQQLLLNGQKVFSLVKPCSRCAIPTINPDDARKQPEVWKRLKALRLGQDGQVYFGQNMLHHDLNSIDLGQQLQQD